MEKKKFNPIELFKSLGKTAKIAISASLACLLFVTILILIFAPSGKTTISAKTALKEIFEISDMYTGEYTYNSIVQVPIDPNKPIDEENAKYYVAYKGTVKTGFDFKKIEIIENNESITVVIPKIEIKNVEVNTDLEYIFTKKKYDTEHTYAEAIAAAKIDLENKAKTNKTLMDTAIESAVDTIAAITKPFENIVENEKPITIVYIDNYSEEEQK